MAPGPSASLASDLQPCTPQASQLSLKAGGSLHLTPPGAQDMLGMDALGMKEHLPSGCGRLRGTAVHRQGWDSVAGDQKGHPEQQHQALPPTSHGSAGYSGFSRHSLSF